MRHEKIFLAVIILIAAIFYFWGLGRNDIVTDEASYMARGIGMLDFNFGIEQSTPIQWVKEVPWWMGFSFHDHPPLVFLFENISFKIFGENVFAGRIPPVLAGLIALLFVYLIASSLYSLEVGLVSAALFAFTVNHVWISRIALQESILISLMLAASYVFLKALQNKKLLIVAGALLGLAVLAKYNALILVPIFFTVLAFRRRDYFLTKEFLFAVAAFLIVASPVIVYNIGLYKTFGHFDFQISYIVGQHVEAWKFMPGKEAIGSLADRLQDYIPALVKTNSPMFLAFAVLGVILAAWQALRKNERKLEHITLFAFLLWFAALMLVVGPTYRFLAMLTPWFALFAGIFVSFIGRRFLYFSPAAAMLLFGVLLLGEASYAYNSVTAVTPLGKAPWTYAAIRSENSNWGYNQLEVFISSELAGKRPELAISFDYSAIAKVLDEAVLEDAKAGLEPAPWAIVYNGNMSMSAQLWTFLRRVVYHGWPIADAATYRKVLAENDSDYFKKLGVEKIYFINNTDKVLLREVRTRPLTADGDIIEGQLQARGIAPREIKNIHGETAFRVYEFAP
ncbi:MAG: glycosyltransferase family 39 protein [Candidatus Sungiibacteriota bacterium]